MCLTHNYNWHNHYFHVPQLFQFSSKVEVLILLFTFLQIYSVVHRDSKVHNFADSLFFFCFFLLIIMRSGLLAGIKWSVCMLKSHRSLCVAFLGQVLGYAYTICLYGRIEISCTFPSGPPCRPSRDSPYTPFVVICCIRLLCDWLFRLCHRIAYIYCFVASYLSSLWYDWFLWCCPVLLLTGIPFLF